MPIRENPMHANCHPPIKMDKVLEDPESIRRLVEANSPYWPVQRYFGGDSEYRASAGSQSEGKPVFIAPVFRGDWAYDTTLIDGVDEILHHPGFAGAAQKMFGGACVRPFSVYCNLTWQLPFNQGGGHTDVPEFRGVSRVDHPIWLLQAMGHSRLFEKEQVKIATTVVWFYKGSDGGFTYWPDGPDAPAKSHEGSIFNTAVVGDNDRMYHRVRPTGDPKAGLVSAMTLESQLEHKGDDRWCISDGNATLAEFDYNTLRISISWKARVFADEADERRYLDHAEDIEIEAVFERFYGDLRARGIDFEMPSDPRRDARFVEILGKTYMHEPSTTDAAA